MNTATECELKSESRSRPDVNFGIFFPCPECKINFNAWEGFVVHMIVDHWWDRELADDYWRQRVALMPAENKPAA
jgi:hypothetical protein